MLVYIKPLSMFPKLHSDRLFGAFLSAISEIYPNKINEIIKDFESDNPPFLISSTFPVLYVGDEKIRFLPKIILNDKIDSSVSQKDIKDFKKIEFIEEKIFNDILDGELSQGDILKNYDKYTRIKNLLMVNDYSKNIQFTSYITPHNSINRLTNRTKIFYNEGDVYGKHIGLFFFIKIFDESYNEIIKSCLKFLKDRGFGKDISTGKGQFDYSIDESNILNFDDEIKEGDKFISLSRFIPNDDDLKFINDESFYEIDSKRSIDKSGDIRKQVHFFKEGSTFLHYKKYYGKIVDVGNYKPAIEYGYAFPIKYGLGGK